jgi:hypothetical protein
MTPQVEAAEMPTVSICAVVQLDDTYIVAHEHTVKFVDTNVGGSVEFDEQGNRQDNIFSPIPDGEYLGRPYFTVKGPVSYETLVEDIDLEHREFYDLPNLRSVLSDALLDYSFGPVKNYKYK